MIKGLVKKLSAAFVVAASAFVVVVALGATLYYALLLVVVPLAAAAITALIFAVIGLIVAVVFLGSAGVTHEEEEDEPEGLGARAYALIRERPIIGIAAALAGGFIILRNPALAALAASAFEKPHRSSRRRRR